MGTRGYIVVKYENKYYRKYNHNDSYPSYLGKNIVNLIKSRKANKTFEYMLYIMDEDEDFEVEDGLYITDNKEEIENDAYIEWVYIVDLDNMIFKIIGYDDELIYNLHEIPDNWLETLE